SQNGDTPDFPASTSGAGSATPPVNDESLDLITLDTTNSSFELEDFDPLNERARPIGTGGTAGTAHATPSSALTPPPPPTPSYSTGSLANASGVTMPTASFPSTSLSVNNPVYPYFTPLYQQNVASSHPHPQHQHHNQHRSLLGTGSDGQSQSQRPFSSGGERTNTSTGAGTGASPRASNVSDDFELLRNYGLDKFSLLDGGSTKPTSLHINGSTGKAEQQHSTTNLLNNAQVPNGRQLGCNGSKYPTMDGSNGQPKSSFSNWTTFD
uniref:Uncharacterized protein n=1 Tax=Anopheles maculatus TaxID=74869 RepID=A0A182T2K6_9DIPT